MSRDKSATENEKPTAGTAAGGSDVDSKAALASEHRLALSRLDRIRLPLLDVHKELLAQERLAYEAVNGKIEGQGRLLNLLMTDPWFDWLHRISQMVVRIDELSEAKPESENDYVNLTKSAESILDEARTLFRPTSVETSATNKEFSARYKTTLQRSSGAVMAHGELLKALFAQ